MPDFLVTNTASHNIPIQSIITVINQSQTSLTIENLAWSLASGPPGLAIQEVAGQPFSNYHPYKIRNHSIYHSHHHYLNHHNQHNHNQQPDFQDVSISEDVICVICLTEIVTHELLPSNRAMFLE